MKNKIEKTNALRLLDRDKIKYDTETYEVTDDLSGVHVIEVLGQEASSVYKTLVLHGDKTGFLVGCIPVDQEIDLKKLAKASGNKKVEMFHQKDLLATTGYIRGGCSPVGMKKLFATYYQEEILKLEKVYVSAGKRGMQVILNPQDLIKVTRGKTADIIKE